MFKLFIPITSTTTTRHIKHTIDALSKGEPTEVDLFFNSTLIYIGAGDIAMVGDSMIIDEAWNAEELKKINVFAETLNEAGYKVKVINPTGFLEPEMVAAANESKADFVVMFTNGSHDFFHDLVGTNTSAIIQKINSPILVIPNDYDLKKLSEAAVGLCLEDEGPEMLRRYIEFARSRKIHSDYVKVDNNFQLDVIIDQFVVQELKKAYPNEIKSVVHRKAKHAGDGLIAFANEVDADLIVTFSTKRNMIDKFFHKSVSRELALHAKKPVLIYHY